MSIDDARQVDEAVFVIFDRAAGGPGPDLGGLRGDRVETAQRGRLLRRPLDRPRARCPGYAALTAGPFRDVTTYFQVARGFRDPLLSDRYFRGPSGRGFITGNPDLDPGDEPAVRRLGALGPGARIAWPSSAISTRSTT